ncbi:uncharacterized protein BO80DRAFT_91342 [Aspergillus ibericus CBS 121593]|uniref:Uncharacterized protein n=1 Tax=Aspergillus ibericus CBS 121593 TaxID=1448316 RepID=A0A395GZE1_9EURO|nr:hypothetical protein BO80DRAFT_91342 [Aspergillus ibericus CBS 121593]RAL00961.1 hypothetical protein BO80DRAFT_91342 [Aspergillus ibericus CBS 121593]
MHKSGGSAVCLTLSIPHICHEDLVSLAAWDMIWMRNVLIALFVSVAVCCACYWSVLVSDWSATLVYIRMYAQVDTMTRCSRLLRLWRVDTVRDCGNLR